MDIERRAYHENSYYCYAQDTARERLGAEDSDSAGVPSSQKDFQETSVSS